MLRLCYILLSGIISGLCRLCNPIYEGLARHFLRKTRLCFPNFEQQDGVQNQDKYKKRRNLNCPVSTPLPSTLIDFKCRFNLYASMTTFFVLIPSAETRADFDSHDVLSSEQHKDNRFEPYEDQITSTEEEVTESVAAIVLRSSLHKVPRRNHRSEPMLRLTTQSAGDRYQLCSEEPFAHQDSPANCTGFLIGDDLLLTAGHCVRTYFACQSIAFIFDFTIDAIQDQIQASQAQNDPSVISRPDSHLRSTLVKANKVFHCSYIIANGLDAQDPIDFAIIRLNRKARSRKKLKFRIKGQVEQDSILSMVGHPLGLPAKITKYGRVKSIENRKYFTSDINSYTGNSGSPVFTQKEGAGGLVEGILVRGKTSLQTTPNRCNRTRLCLGSHCRNSDIIRTSNIVPFLPQPGFSLSISSACLKPISLERFAPFIPRPGSSPQHDTEPTFSNALQNPTHVYTFQQFRAKPTQSSLSYFRGKTLTTHTKKGGHIDTAITQYRPNFREAEQNTARPSIKHRFAIEIRNNGSINIRGAKVHIHSNTHGVTITNPTFMIPHLSQQSFFRIDSLLIETEGSAPPKELSLTLSADLPDGTQFESLPMLVHLRRGHLEPRTE